MKRDSFQRTEVQVEMLLFFAGRRDLPCGGTRTTGALITRGLLARVNESGRYEATEVGQQVAAQLDQALTGSE